MSAQRSLFSLTAALLYFAPFMSGLSAAPEVLLVFFAAVLMLWIVALRPKIWSEVTASGTPLSLALYVGGLTIIQMLLVAFAFALGRGLAGLIGMALPLPVWLPILLALAALPLSLMARDRRGEDAAEAGQARDKDESPKP